MDTASLGEQLSFFLSHLEDLKLTLPVVGVDFPLLDILFAVLINYSYRSALGENHARIGWGQGFIATLVMAAGGGSTVSVLQGEPLGIFKSNKFWAIHGTVYWLMNSNPYVYQLTDVMFTMPMVSHLFRVSDGVLRNKSICQLGVQGVSNHPSLGADKWVAQIVCGTLAGCGGALWIGKGNGIRERVQSISLSTYKFNYLLFSSLVVSSIGLYIYNHGLSQLCKRDRLCLFVNRRIDMNL
ncbi:hypothetical protein BDF14DRAFT_1731627 [Spinellus fusiger]|nr:hypothetical protein BDF14DRAFT_1731627 [Spinellus fusiger]